MSGRFVNEIRALMTNSGCLSLRLRIAKIAPSLLGAALKAKQRVCQSRLAVNRVVP
jgi:hypothetical protein